MGQSTSAVAAIAVAALVLSGSASTGSARSVSSWIARWPRTLPRRQGATRSLGRRGPLDEPAGVDGARPPETFRSLEHGTTGSARIVELEDGSRFVRLEDLDTSDGPDLRVYLTDQPVSDDWGVWDDGRYVDLGALKGNVGDSNYRIPEDVDLSGFRTAVIWCRRFTVGFGVAPIAAR